MTGKFKTALFCALFAVTGSVHAIDPIPEEEGWSGFVVLGLGGIRAETNTIEGIDSAGLEIGDAEIDSLDDSPDSNSELLPQLNLNVKYTFATQTQVFIGNSLEDIVELDTVSTFGVRQQFSDRSILEVAVVASPSFSPVQVWADPYVTGQKRESTDRISKGIRLEYDRILGSGFGVQLTSRDTEIGDELSGTTQTGLSSAQLALLDREGTTEQIAGHYRFKPVGKNLFEVRLSSSSDDIDGDAMSGDATEVSLTHAHLMDRYIFATTAFINSKEYDARHPVFEKTRDDDTLGLAFFVFDKGLFDSKDWWGQASFVWVEQDSNIDFYDQSATIVTLGAQRNF
jgi:hypothetical protein